MSQQRNRHRCCHGGASALEVITAIDTDVLVDMFGAAPQLGRLFAGAAAMPERRSPGRFIGRMSRGSDRFWKGRKFSAYDLCHESSGPQNSRSHAGSGRRTGGAALDEPVGATSALAEAPADTGACRSSANAARVAARQQREKPWAEVSRAGQYPAQQLRLI